MRRETLTFEISYLMFDVGERIRRQETSRAHPFPEGVHVVTRCEPLTHYLDGGAWVWIEGHERPYLTTYLTSAEGEP